MDRPRGHATRIGHFGNLADRLHARHVIFPRCDADDPDHAAASASGVARGTFIPAVDVGHELRKTPEAAQSFTGLTFLNFRGVGKKEGVVRAAVFKRAGIAPRRKSDSDSSRAAKPQIAAAEHHHTRQLSSVSTDRRP